MKRFAPLPLFLAAALCLLPAPPLRAQDGAESGSAKPAPADPTDPRLTFHAAPKPLPEGAQTADWPRFLGPADASTTPETKLLKEIPAGGPKIVWEVEKGDGYATPAIAGGDVFFFHRWEKNETIECRDAETGRLTQAGSIPIGTPMCVRIVS